MSQQGIPAGWYTDPANTSQNRFWDGEGWTDKTMLIPKPVTAQLPPPTGAPLAAGTRVEPEPLELIGHHQPSSHSARSGLPLLPIAVGAVALLLVVVGVVWASTHGSGSAQSACGKDLDPYLAFAAGEVNQAVRSETSALPGGDAYRLAPTNGPDMMTQIFAVSALRMGAASMDQFTAAHPECASVELSAFVVPLNALGKKSRVDAAEVLALSAPGQALSTFYGLTETFPIDGETPNFQTQAEAPRPKDVIARVFPGDDPATAAMIQYLMSAS